MKIKYKIVENYPSEYQVVVRYYTDMITEQELNVIPYGDVAYDDSLKDDGTPKRCRSDVSLDLPIPLPSVDELNRLFLINAPVVWLEKLEKIKDPTIDTSMDTIDSLLNVENTIDKTEYDALFNTTDTSLTDAEISALLTQLESANTV